MNININDREKMLLMAALMDKRQLLKKRCLNESISKTGQFMSDVLDIEKLMDRIFTQSKIEKMDASTFNYKDIICTAIIGKTEEMIRATLFTYGEKKVFDKNISGLGTDKTEAICALICSMDRIESMLKVI